MFKKLLIKIKKIMEEVKEGIKEEVKEVEVKEEVKEEVVEKKENKEGKFYVYTPQMGIHSHCTNSEEAEKIADEIGGTYKEVE